MSSESGMYSRSRLKLNHCRAWAFCLCFRNDQRRPSGLFSQATTLRGSGSIFLLRLLYPDRVADDALVPGIYALGLYDDAAIAAVLVDEVPGHVLSVSYGATPEQEHLLCVCHDQYNASLVAKFPGRQVLGLIVVGITFSEQLFPGNRSPCRRLTGPGTAGRTCRSRRWGSSGCP